MKKLILGLTGIVIGNFTHPNFLETSISKENNTWVTEYSNNRERTFLLNLKGNHKKGDLSVFDKNGALIGYGKTNFGNLYLAFSYDNTEEIINNERVLESILKKFYEEIDFGQIYE